METVPEFEAYEAGSDAKLEKVPAYDPDWVPTEVES